MAKPIFNKAVEELALKKSASKIYAVPVDDEPKGKKGKGEGTLTKSLMEALSTPDERTDRLGFTVNPHRTPWSSVYITNDYLVPNFIKKRIAIQDSMVAGINLLRTNQVAAFARPRPDDHSPGFVIEPTTDTAQDLSNIEDPEQQKQAKKELQKRVALATDSIMNCGEIDPLDRQDFNTFIKMIVRDAMTIGSVSVERIYKPTVRNGRVFKKFRALDAGTIYRARPQKDAAPGVRKSSKSLLEKVTGRKIDIEMFEQDAYAWIQVMNDNMPVQAFTAQECVVHNFYPSTNYELVGYPLSPIDTIVKEITTHLNIQQWNYLYFQNGRATRGMLVIQSEDIDEKEVAKIRQSWNSQINSTANAWRTPVFGIPVEDTITWQPIDQASRDGEWQNLADMNIRAICSAFQVSPEELPGYAYLSKGTNAQSLVEKDNEFKLVAARDQGLRPLLGAIENLINTHILPEIDPVLAKKCVFKLVGLDAESPEKKDIGNQRRQQLDMVYDELLASYNKPPLGRELGGMYPFNPNIQGVMEKFHTVGYLKEKMLGFPGASQDPTLQYVPNPFWFQWQAFVLQKEQMAAQMQMAAQQPPGGPDDGSGGGGDVSSGGTAPNAQNVPTDKTKNSPQATDPLQNTSDQTATANISQASKELNKAFSFDGLSVLKKFYDLGYDIDLPNGYPIEIDGKTVPYVKDGRKKR